MKSYAVEKIENEAKRRIKLIKDCEMVVGASMMTHNVADQLKAYTLIYSACLESESLYDLKLKINTLYIGLFGRIDFAIIKLALHYTNTFIDMERN